MDKEEDVRYKICEQAEDCNVCPIRYACVLIWKNV